MYRSCIGENSVRIKKVNNRKIPYVYFGTPIPPHNNNKKAVISSGVTRICCTTDSIRMSML